MIHHQRQVLLRVLLTATLMTAPAVSLSFAEELPEGSSVAAKAPLSRKDGIRAFNNEYRHVQALYKAKLYSDAEKKIEELQWQLAAEDLPAGYRRKMRKRLETLASGMAERQARDDIREQKRRQKEARRGGQSPIVEAENQNDILPSPQPGPAGDQAGRFSEGVLAMKEQLARERRFLESEFQTRLAALYKRGVDRFQAQDFGAAEEIFHEVDRLSPGYKETRQYLKKAEDKREQKSMPVPVESVPASFSPERAAIISQALDLMEQNPEETLSVGKEEKNL